MVATFPLSLGSFLEALPVRDIMFTLPEAVEMSRTAGGDIGTASLGTRLWQGEITLGRLRRHEAHDAEALVDLARGTEASFLASPLQNPAPQADPLGALLGTATPRIGLLPLDARLIGLKGLPAGYRLKRGDFLAFTYRANPTRYALHRVQDALVIAASNGTIAAIEVRPHIRPGAVLDAPVTLLRPACKAIIIPDTVQAGRASRFITEGLSFEFMQTLR